MSEADHSGAVVTVLVLHHADHDAVAAVQAIADEVRAGTAAPHLRLAVRDPMPADAARWDVTDVGVDGERPGGRLFDRLASVGRIARLRCVAVSTRGGDAITAIALDQAMDSLQSTLDALLGSDRPRTQARVAIQGYGDPLVHPRFFSNFADANLIVAPFDRLQDSSIARPVDRAATATFHAHAAVELLSICGLWRSMDHAVIDKVRPSAGRGSRPPIRFVQSRVRLMRTQPLPVAELLAEDREFPLPEGFVPTSDSETSARDATQSLVPDELTFEQRTPPAPQRLALGVWSLVLILLREFGASIAQLPGVVWRAAAGQFTSISQEGLQRLLGPSSRLTVASSAAEDEEGSSADGAARPSAISDPEPRVQFDPVPGYVWTGLVSETLGLIDGDPDCRDLRERVFGDHRVVANQRHVLLAGAGGLLDTRGLLTAGSATPEAGEDEAVGAHAQPSSDPIDVLGPADHRTGEDMRERWPEVLRQLGSQRIRAVKTFRDATPIALVNGVLTLRFESVRNATTLSQIEAEHAALVVTIDQMLSRAVVHLEVLFAGESERWRPTVRVATLARVSNQPVEVVLAQLGDLGIMPEGPDDVMEPSQVDRYLADRAIPLTYQQDADGITFGFRRAAAPEPHTEIRSVSGSQPAQDQRDEADHARTPGVLAAVSLEIRAQAERADQARASLMDTLEQAEHTDPGVLSLSPAVPVATAAGAALLAFVLGLTAVGDLLVDVLQLNPDRQEALFVFVTVSLFLGGVLLTNIGNRLGTQARVIVLGVATVVLFTVTALAYSDLRPFIPLAIRSSRTVGLVLSALPLAMVVIATLQSYASKDELRQRTVRVLVFLAGVYTVTAAIFWQRAPEALLQRLPEPLFQRVIMVLVVAGISLLVLSLVVLTIVRLRLARVLEHQKAVAAWARAELARVAEIRERLRAGDKQWRVTAVTLMQLLREPFGPLEVRQASWRQQPEPAVLKHGAVRLRLSERGAGDLEARMRARLITVSWLRRRYETFVEAYLQRLAARSGVAVRDLADRRPECDATVPDIVGLEAGRSRGDRAESLAGLVRGGYAGDLAAVIDELDVIDIFGPILADPGVQMLGGDGQHAETIGDYFGQILPEGAPTLISGLVTTVLAANDGRNRLQPYLWWPMSLLGFLPGDAAEWVAAEDARIVRHGTIGGAGIDAIRVDVSEEFAYKECIGAVGDDEAEQPPPVSPNAATQRDELDDL